MEDKTEWKTGHPKEKGNYTIMFEGQIDEYASWNGLWWTSSKFGWGGSDDLMWKEQSKKNEHPPASP